MNKFTNQGALTIITKVKPEETEKLRGLLHEIDEDVEDNEHVPFKKLTTIHFARFVVVDKSLDDRARLRSVDPFLVFSSNYDEPLDEHLKQLVDVAGEGLDKIYSHCEGYTDKRRLLAYLRKHRSRYGAFHNATPGLSVERIHMEARLRDKLENFIDEQGSNRDRSSEDPLSIRTKIVEYVGQTDFSWALKPAGGPPLSWRLRWLRLVVPLIIILATLVLVPGILLASNPPWAVIYVLFLIMLVVILGYKEDTDKIFPYTRYDERAKELAAREDQVVQNQMTNMVDMKPGLFRLLALKLVFLTIETAARTVLTKGKLGGVATIHFARWIFVDNNRGLLFFSNYGSSWESYLGDFVDLAAGGLTAVWSNTVLYPWTKFLVLKGATDEQRFKTWARAQQMPTDVWYTAYDYLTVKNILNNKEIRKGLSGDMTREQEALEWLRRF